MHFVFNILHDEKSLSVINATEKHHKQKPTHPERQIDVSRGKLSMDASPYFSRISCTFYFGQMFNGFLTSTFDFY